MPEAPDSLAPPKPECNEREIATAVEASASLGAPWDDAAKRGLGYQTMLKVIVREHLDEY